MASAYNARNINSENICGGGAESVSSAEMSKSQRNGAGLKTHLLAKAWRNSGGGENQYI